jgi:hypothetical protein
MLMARIGPGGRAGEGWSGKGGASRSWPGASRWPGVRPLMACSSVRSTALALGYAGPGYRAAGFRCAARAGPRPARSKSVRPPDGPGQSAHWRPSAQGPCCRSAGRWHSACRLAARWWCGGGSVAAQASSVVAIQERAGQDPAVPGRAGASWSGRGAGAHGRERRGSVGDRPQRGCGSVGDRPQRGRGSVGDRPQRGCGSVGDRPQRGVARSETGHSGGIIGRFRALERR